MGRHKKSKSVEEGQEEQDPVQPSEPIPPSAPAGEPEERDPDEPTVDVKMRGRASKVAELITKNKRGGSRDDDPEPAVDPGGPASKRRRHQALQNPRNRVFVKRIRPIEWEGRKANYEVYSEDCPLTVQMVERAVTEQHGGGVFQAHILDRQTGESVDAWNFQSNDDPILKPLPDATGVSFEEEAEPTDEEQMEQMIRLNQKRITMETLNQQLAELKGQRQGAGTGSPVVEAKIGRLENLMAQKFQQDQVAAVEAKYQKMVDDLSAKVAELSKPKVEDTGKRDGIIELMLEQSKQASEDRRASDQRFNQMFQNMQENSLNGLRAEVRELKAVPKGDESLIDQLYKAKEIAKVFGVAGGGDADIEKPWYVELKEAVTTVAETVTEFIKARAATGQPISQEEFARQFSGTADRVAQRIIDAAPRGLPAPAQIVSVPVPQAAPVPLSGAPGSTFRSRSQSERPVLVPVAAQPRSVAPPRPVAPAPRPPVALVPPVQQAAPVPPVPPPTPTPAPELPTLPTFEADVRSRVGNVMVVMDREMALRPNRYTWTQYAWEEFPADLLDAIAQCADSTGMIEVIMRGVGADPAPSVEKFKALPKIVQWLNRGLADIKVWVEARNEDPDFDPFEDEEEEEPGGEGGALAPPPGVGAVAEDGGGNGEVG
jgi:hypothetical protein